MVLTRDWKESVKERMDRDSDYRQGLLQEAVEVMIGGEVDLAKSMLRDYINASVGFVELSRLTGKQSKSLMRMFSQAGNPQARNLFEVIRVLQQREGVRLEVRAEKAA